MKEFNELNKEKQEELFSVIECCKVSESEFEKKFDILNIDDKKIVSLYMLDNVYEFVEDKEDDDKKNKDILTFLKKKKYKLFLTEMLNEIRGDDDDLFKNRPPRPEHRIKHEK